MFLWGLSLFPLPHVLSPRVIYGMRFNCRVIQVKYTLAWSGCRSLYVHSFFRSFLFCFCLIDCNHTCHLVLAFLPVLTETNTVPPSYADWLVCHLNQILKAKSFFEFTLCKRASQHTRIFLRFFPTTVKWNCGMLLIITRWNICGLAPENT